MRLNACAGIPDEAAEEIRHLDFGVAVCGCVAQECERILAEDIQHNDDLRTRLVKSFGVQAYCCHPLMAQDRLIGTLSFGTKTRPVFTDDDVALMKSVCDQVAVAMQRLLAQDELRRLNESLEQQVAERTRQVEARSRQLQALAVELIEAEEQERRRIADHLHDDLQQILAAARMQLESVCQVRPEETILLNIRELMEESINKSRQLSHELSPPVLAHSNLVAALNWLVRYYRERFGLQVELTAEESLPDESPPLKVFLFRAVQELLFNTVKHAGVNNARVSLSSSDDHFVVTVSDEGQGIKPDILDSDGSPVGLGLLSLRERARHVGGSFTIEDNAGQGSRFILTVPFDIVKTEKVNAPSTKPPISRPEPACALGAADGIRVLFVDDHQVMRQGLIGLLTGKPNIRIVGEAADGYEAIEQVRTLHPNIVVMDINMPKMDGIEATRRIKAEWPNVCIIGLSMFDDEQITQKMREAGAEAFMSKTASSVDLLKTIYGIGHIDWDPDSGW